MLWHLKLTKTKSAYNNASYDTFIDRNISIARE